MQQPTNDSPRQSTTPTYIGSFVTYNVISYTVYTAFLPSVSNFSSSCTNAFLKIAYEQSTDHEACENDQRTIAPLTSLTIMGGWMLGLGIYFMAHRLTKGYVDLTFYPREGYNSLQHIRQAAETTQGHTTIIQQQLEALNPKLENVDTLYAQLAALTQEHETATKTVGQLTQELEKQKQAADLQDQQNQDEQEEWRQSREALENKLAELTQEQETATKTVEQLRQELENQTTEQGQQALQFVIARGELEDKVKELNSHLEKLTQAQETVHKAEHQLQQEVANLKQAADLQHRQNLEQQKQLLQQVEALKNKLAQLTHEKDTAIKTVQQLQQASNGYYGKIANEQLVLLERQTKEREAMNLERQQNQEQQKMLQQQVNELTHQLELQQIKETDTIKKTEDRLQKELENQQQAHLQQLQQNQVQQKMLQQQVEKVTKQYKDHLTQAQQTIKKTEEQLQQEGEAHKQAVALQQQLNRQQQAQLQQEAEDLRNQLKDQVAKQAQLQQEAKDWMTTQVNELERLRQEKETLQKQYAELQKIVPPNLLKKYLPSTSRSQSDGSSPAGSPIPDPRHSPMSRSFGTPTNTVSHTVSQPNVPSSAGSPTSSTWSSTLAMGSYSMNQSIASSPGLSNAPIVPPTFPVLPTDTSSLSSKVYKKSMDDV